MCLGIPAKVVQIDESALLIKIILTSTLGELELLTSALLPRIC